MHLNYLYGKLCISFAKNMPSIFKYRMCGFFYYRKKYLCTSICNNDFLVIYKLTLRNLFDGKKDKRYVLINIPNLNGKIPIQHDILCSP